MLTPDDIAILSVGLLTLCCAVWGTWRFVLRLWRARASTRMRALVWSLIPVSIGGFFGYVEGTYEGLFLGVFLTGTIAALVLCVATALWIPQSTRARLGTVLFEAAALLIWGFVAVFWATAFA